MWGNIAIAFLLAFITAFVITPYTIRLAKKLGAVDDPKDKRRINIIAMPRLRWTSCNCRFCNISSVFINYHDNGRINCFKWAGKTWCEPDWFWNWYFSFKYDMLFR